MPPAPGEQIGKYQLAAQLGAGAYGTVFHARDVAINDQCALKFVRVSSGANLSLILQEAQVLRQCRSQHIVHINGADVVQLNDGLYVTIDMEYLPDGSLEARALNHGLDFRETLTSMRHALLGLSTAHQNGVIHRDVKPANIMIDGASYKLSDFGIAHLKAIATGIGDIYVTNAAPELLRGSAANERTDIYAAGVTLYRLLQLVGGSTIDHEEVEAWENSGMLEGLPDFLGFPAFTPARLRSVIRKSTAPAAADRYDSVEDMLAALEVLRPGISWKKEGSGAWTGEQAGKRHSLTVEAACGGHELVVQCNGRRRNADCQKFARQSVARDAILKHVAKTAFA